MNAPTRKKSDPRYYKEKTYQNLNIDSEVFGQNGFRWYTWKDDELLNIWPKDKQCPPAKGSAFIHLKDCTSSKLRKLGYIRT